jgi:hypothetical protein
MGLCGPKFRIVPGVRVGASPTSRVVLGFDGELEEVLVYGWPVELADRERSGGARGCR